MTLREYSGGAAPTTLAGLINASAMSFTVATGGGTGYPTGATGPFFVALGSATANEEKILCASRAGDVFTVATGGRGADGTTALTHQVAESVRHVFTALDAREANAHVNASIGVHGLVGEVVGTTDVQTLSGKTINGNSNTFSNIPQAAITNLEDDLDDMVAALLAHENDIQTHGLVPGDGPIVGSTQSTELRNKLINGNFNTLSNLPQSAITGLTSALLKISGISNIGCGFSSMSFDFEGKLLFSHDLGWTPNVMGFFAHQVEGAGGDVFVSPRFTGGSFGSTSAWVVAKVASTGAAYTSGVSRVGWIGVKFA